MADSKDSRYGGSLYRTSDENHGYKPGASMTDSIWSRSLTSDEYHDPFCEPCAESRGKNVIIECFCKDCNQYLCIDCYATHQSLRASKGHVIQTGDDMPKSLADKPPRYDTCDDHPKHVKDQFCCDHGSLVCSTCCSTSHSMCVTKSVADTCQYVQQSEIDILCDVNKNYKSQLMKFLSSMEKHGGKLTEQKKTMLKDAETTYDKLLAEINRGYKNIKTAIQAEFNSKEATVSQLKQKINAQMTRVDAEVNFTNKIKGSSINAKTFLSLQESIKSTRESVAAIKSLIDSLDLRLLSFEPGKDIQMIISQPVSFGSINKLTVNLNVNVSVPDIKLPISVRRSTGAVGTTKQQSPGSPVSAVGTKQQGGPGSAVQQASFWQIKATPVGTFNVRTQEDKQSCSITGIAVTPSGQRLLVDNKNNKVKLFSQDMRFLSSVAVPPGAYDITMVNEREAVVTLGQALAFLEVSDRRLRTKHTINLSFDSDSLGITYSKDKLIVTAHDECQSEYPTEVKALDLQGRELWSVRHSFDDVQYVCCNSDGRWVAVTDWLQMTITVLDTINGAVVTSRRLENSRGPWKSGQLRGVSVDTDDNIFVSATPNVVVLSGDLQNKRVLCNMGDTELVAIAYDETKRQLIISHSERNEVSCLQLS